MKAPDLCSWLGANHSDSLREVLINSDLSFPRKRESMRFNVLDPRFCGDDELFSVSSYREDEQQRQGRKDQLSCFVNCEAGH
jgi:hypothetical protein